MPFFPGSIFSATNPSPTSPRATPTSPSNEVTALNNEIIAIETALGTNFTALLASTALTGNPTAPTQAGSDNSTRLATTAYVTSATATATSYLPVFNVKQYSAVGNGSTDDTSHINNAISAASSAGGGIVFFPAGSYLISSSLAIPSNVRLMGVNGVNWFVPANGSRIVVASSMLNPLLTVAAGVTNWGVEGLAFTTTSSTSTALTLQVNGTIGSNSTGGLVRQVVSTNLGGVSLTYLTRSLIQDVVMQSYQGNYGFSSTNCSIVFFNRCNAAPAGSGSIGGPYIANYYVVGCASMNFMGCEGNGSPYYQLLADSTIDTECWDFEGNGAVQDQVHFQNGCVNWSFYQGYIAQTCATAFFIQNSNTIRISGCSVNNFTGSAFFLDGGSSPGFTKNIIIQGNWVDWESVAGPIIVMQNAAWNVTVTGNVFEGSEPATPPTWISNSSTHIGRGINVVGNLVNNTLSVSITSTTTVNTIESNTGYNTPRDSVLTYTSDQGATPAINTDMFNVVHMTGQTSAITGFTMTGNPKDGDVLRISINSTNTGLGFNATGTNIFESSTTTLPNALVANTRLDIVLLWNTETSKWRCVGVS